MAAMWRNVVLQGFKNAALLRSVLPGNYIVTRGAGGYARWKKRAMKDLWNRRLEMGPDPERHRSEWRNWNYDAEIFAFGKRLGEDFQSETLKTVFTHRSYVEKEEAERKGLGVESDIATLDIVDNTELSHKGEKLASDYIKAYLRSALPLYPEEGICGVHDYLMCDEMLAYIASHIGIKDLVLCAEFPPETSTLAQVFKAVIGGLAQDQSVERAQLFVQDLILTQLVGKDLLDMWVDMINPMGALAGILAQQGRGEPEPRLLWETGSQTMLAAYLVGIYSDKQLIGKGPGETLTIAEEMAARDALRRLFKITENRTPFKFGKDGHSLELASSNFKPNPSLADISLNYVQ